MFATYVAGRGYGKTRIGTEFIHEEAAEMGEAFRGALVGRAAADVRDIIVEGESGIMRKAPPGFRPSYEPSKRRLTWPNGAMATLLSADEPEQARGLQQNVLWGDEVAAWRFPEMFDMLMFGLRLQPFPRALFTTTPKPTRLIRDLLSNERTWVVRGSTYDNTDNLAPSFIEAIRRRYEGTTLGRQEVYAEIMDEAPGALWRRTMFQRLDHLPEFDRIVVAIDPSATANDSSDEAGIVAGGAFVRGGVRHAVIIGDYSARLRPAEWSARGLTVYDALRAGRLVGEVNHGGDMVESLVKMVAADLRRSGKRESAEVSFRSVHASQGKATRAEPVVALYEQGRVWHLASSPTIEGVSGRLADMEDQMCSWTPGERSPDRMDAAVWLLTDLILDAEAAETPHVAFHLAGLARPSLIRGA